MVTREMIKAEVDLIREEYLDILYRIVKAFEAREAKKGAIENWASFVDNTYGSLSDAPITREPQGMYEKRESLK